MALGRLPSPLAAFARAPAPAEAQRVTADLFCGWSVVSHDE